jgi:hypothetical protein
VTAKSNTSNNRFCGVYTLNTGFALGSGFGLAATSCDKHLQTQETLLAFPVAKDGPV